MGWEVGIRSRILTERAVHGTVGYIVWVPLGMLGSMARGLMLGERSVMVGMADVKERHSLAEVRLS
jgi:hypothetical protein